MAMDEAISEGIVFLEPFRDVPDPRQAGKVVYPLNEVLPLCLLAVLAGAEAFTDIARFGVKKLDLLRRFLPFRDGTPAHDHLGDIFAARQRLVLGQVKGAEKSNEIVAIPRLLDMMSVEGAVVTIDAMGCQREIAKKIIDKKADYVLALRGNQGSLREDVDLFVAEQKANAFQDTTVSRDQTVDGDHGRIETRTTTVIHDVAWRQERHGW